MPYSAGPDPNIQDDKFMDLQVQRPTLTVPLVPDVASVRGAPSHLGGIAPDVGSMLGLPLEASPPSHARAHEQQNANMMSADPRVEPPASEHASALTEDAYHHRSVSEVGATGPAPEAPHASASHNNHTPNHTTKLAAWSSVAQRRPDKAWLQNIGHIRASQARARAAGGRG